MSRKERVTSELRHSYRDGEDYVARQCTKLNTETLAEISDNLERIADALEKLTVCTSIQWPPYTPYDPYNPIRYNGIDITCQEENNDQN